MKHRFISFLSDFGLADDFVGTCHGVIKRIAPDAEALALDDQASPDRLAVPFATAATA